VACYRVTLPLPLHLPLPLTLPNDELKLMGLQHFYCQVSHPDPYLRTGPRGPGPGRQIFRGGILKNSRLKYGMREKKGCPRERNLRAIYTENNVGTEFSRYDATGGRGRGAKIFWAQGRKVPKYGPGPHPFITPVRGLQCVRIIINMTPNSSNYCLVFMLRIQFTNMAASRGLVT